MKGEYSVEMIQTKRYKKEPSLTFQVILQGYPQRTRLQRRLCGIYLVRFFAIRVPIVVGQNWFISVLGYLVNHRNLSRIKIRY